MAAHCFTFACGPLTGLMIADEYAVASPLYFDAQGTPVDPQGPEAVTLTSDDVPLPAWYTPALPVLLVP